MTFTDNLGAFLRVTGLENADSALAFAELPWPSDDARDDFIAALQAPEGS